MNNTVNSYYAKGKKNFTLYMPCGITNLEKMIMSRSKNVKCLLVGLKNGEVRLYSEKYLITTIKNDVSFIEVNLVRISQLLLNSVFMEEKKVPLL